MAKIYKHTKDVLRHSAIVKRRKKIRNLKITLWGVVVLAIFGAFLYVMRFPMFNIGDIQVVGLQSLNTQVLIDNVNQSLKGNAYLVIPKRNFFVYPKDEIIANIKKTHPAFNSVDLEIIDGNVLQVTVDERLAVAVLCNSLAEIYQNTYQKCAFLDKQGFAFAMTTGIPDPSLFKLVVETEGPQDANQEFSIDRVLIDADLLASLQAAAKNLAEKGYVIAYTKVVSDDYIEYKMIDNGIIKVPFKVTENALSILRTALNSKPLNNQKFEYVDVRFGNKVFYKIGNAPAVSSTVGVSVGAPVGISATSTVNVSASSTATTTKPTAKTVKKALQKKR